MRAKILAVLIIIFAASQIMPAQAVRVNNVLFPEDLVTLSDTIIVGHVEDFADRQRPTTAGEPCGRAATMVIMVDKVLSGACSQKNISVFDLEADYTSNESGSGDKLKWQYQWMLKENVIASFEATPAELIKPNLWFLRRGKHWDRFHNHVSSNENWCPVAIQPAKLAPFYTALLSKYPQAAVKSIRKGDDLIDTCISAYLQRLKAKRTRQRFLRNQ